MWVLFDLRAANGGGETLETSSSASVDAEYLYLEVHETMEIEVTKEWNQEMTLGTGAHTARTEGLNMLDRSSALTICSRKGLHATLGTAARRLTPHEWDSRAPGANLVSENAPFFSPVNNQHVNKAGGERY